MIERTNSWKELLFPERNTMTWADLVAEYDIDQDSDDGGDLFYSMTDEDIEKRIQSLSMQELAVALDEAKGCDCHCSTVAAHYKYEIFRRVIELVRVA